MKSQYSLRSVLAAAPATVMAVIPKNPRREISDAISVASHNHASLPKGGKWVAINKTIIVRTQGDMFFDKHVVIPFPIFQVVLDESLSKTGPHQNSRQQSLGRQRVKVRRRISNTRPAIADQCVEPPGASRREHDRRIAQRRSLVWWKQFVDVAGSCEGFIPPDFSGLTPWHEVGVADQGKNTTTSRNGR